MKTSYIVGLSIGSTLIVCALAVGFLSYMNGKGAKDMNTVILSESTEMLVSGSVPEVTVPTEKTYDAHDVSHHGTEKDCWVIIDEEVYDMTPLISFHPGGREAIIESCGEDATEGFAMGGKTGKGHSPSATASLEKYYVGMFSSTTSSTTLAAHIEGEKTIAMSASHRGVKDTPMGKVDDNECLARGQQDFACYETFYKDVVEKEGVAPAFADLKERYAVSPLVQSYCHQLTHVIGRAGARLSSGVGDAFTRGDTMCWSGFYHGAMEEFMGDIPLPELPKRLDAICSDIPGKGTYSFLYFNCIHGTGHGLMELFEGDLFASLDACDGLTGRWEQESCYGGVFMENIMAESRGAVSEYLKTDDPLYPCNAVKEEFKTSCYLMQTSHMLTIYGGDFTKVFKACDSVEEGHRATCYQSLGRDASGRTTSNAEQSKATCMLGGTPFARENCIVGAVKDFISYFHSDVEAKQFCTSLDAPLKDSCLSTTESYYKTF